MDNVRYNMRTIKNSAPLNYKNVGTGIYSDGGTNKSVQFSKYLDSAYNRASVTLSAPPAASPINNPSAPIARIAFRSVKSAADSYNTNKVPEKCLSDWEKYKDDQLLSNPGGDNYNYVKKEKIMPSGEGDSFTERVGKDISDAFHNIRNFFSNFFFGAEKLYRDENDQIKETKQNGFLKSLLDFTRDFGSALSFGMWRPDGEPEPDGFVNRGGFFLTKIKEAFMGDLAEGVPGSFIQMGEDMALAGWNLLEAIPDSTIGNFNAGRKITTAIFDNGQVAIDYLTDILPSGEAWLRVHAFDIKDLKNIKAPVLYNIKMPENYQEDARWHTIRNTPLRKKIETIGALLGDIFTVKILGSSEYFSNKRQDGN